MTSRLCLVQGKVVPPREGKHKPSRESVRLVIDHVPRRVMSAVLRMRVGAFARARAAGVSSLHTTAMAQYKAPLNEVRFLADNVWDLPGHYKVSAW